MISRKRYGFFFHGRIIKTSATLTEMYKCRKMEVHIFKNKKIKVSFHYYFIKIYLFVHFLFKWKHNFSINSCRNISSNWSNIVNLKLNLENYKKFLFGKWPTKFKLEKKVFLYISPKIISFQYFLWFHIT